MNDAEQSPGYEQAMKRRIGVTPHCTGGSCRQGRARCETPEACGIPVDRRTFEPDLTITGPHRARKQRAMKRARSFLTTFGIAAVFFIIARLVLRALFPGVF